MNKYTIITTNGIFECSDAPPRDYGMHGDPDETTWPRDAEGIEMELCDGEGDSLGQVRTGHIYMPQVIAVLRRPDGTG